MLEDWVVPGRLDPRARVGSWLAGSQAIWSRSWRSCGGPWATGSGSRAGGFRLRRTARAVAKSVIEARILISAPQNGQSRGSTSQRGRPRVSDSLPRWDRGRVGVVGKGAKATSAPFSSPAHPGGSGCLTAGKTLRSPARIWSQVSCSRKLKRDFVFGLDGGRWLRLTCLVRPLQSGASSSAAIRDRALGRAGPCMDRDPMGCHPSSRPRSREVPCHASCLALGAFSGSRRSSARHPGAGRDHSWRIAK
jgi:hypothetical protein